MIIPNPRGPSAAADVLAKLDGIRGFRKVLERAAADLSPSGAPKGLEDALLVSVAELILDGLYSHNKVNKKSRRTGLVYGA